MLIEKSREVRDPCIAPGVCAEPALATSSVSQTDSLGMSLTEWNEPIRGKPQRLQKAHIRVDRIVEGSSAQAANVRQSWWPLGAVERHTEHIWLGFHRCAPEIS